MCTIATPPVGEPSAAPRQHSYIKATAVHITETGIAGDLNEHGGIISGRVTQYADALQITTGAVLEAVEAAGVTPMVDTARQNDGKERDRPTDPDRRCLAMTRNDFARVLTEAQ
jgi:hypothetical protein